MKRPGHPYLKAIYTHRVVLKRVLVVGFAILVLGMLTFAVLKVDWPAVLTAMKALPVHALMWAGLFAFLTYGVYSSFDLLGRLYTGHHLAWWRSVMVSFISYAFTMSLGSTIGGVGLRIRLYAKQGLRQGDIVRIWAISVMTNWTGYLLMSGIVLLTGHVMIPANWAVGQLALRLAGLLCVVAVLAYILAAAFMQQRAWTIRGHIIELPDVRIAIAQALLGAAVWTLLAGVAYSLFQQRIPYLVILGIVLISAVAGLAARIPGGLGVIEYVFITMLGQAIPRNETLAVLLVYRLFYYIGPLIIAGLCYLVAEAGMRRTHQHST